VRMATLYDSPSSVTYGMFLSHLIFRRAHSVQLHVGLWLLLNIFRSSIGPLDDYCKSLKLAYSRIVDGGGNRSGVEVPLAFLLENNSS
jgi:hypothetical protein